MADFFILDGTPFDQSDCIRARRTQTVFTSSFWDGDPGKHEDPVPGKDCWLYVKVGQNGAFDASTERAILKIYVARQGTDFVAKDLKPTQADARWENISGHDVIFAGEIDLAVPGMQPGSGLSRWYELKWYGAFVPPKTIRWKPCLLAFADRRDLTNTKTVKQDEGFAQKNFRLGK